MTEKREAILRRARALLSASREGHLGGAKMPEDENPGLPRGSAENYLYFTLPMALNYQRNSYVLWECARRMYDDEQARTVFDSRAAAAMPEEQLRAYLTAYKVALQPNRQPRVWKTLCGTVAGEFGGDIRNLFARCHSSAAEVKAYMEAHKKAFPCLSGPKIANYWLHVLEKYTDIRFTDRESITVAPDTHVRQASLRLGVITPEEAEGAAVQKLLAQRWQEILRGTEILPIDMHTPLWLWGHGNFRFDPDAYLRGLSL